MPAEEMMEKRVHHIQRVIAKNMPAEGSVAAEEVNMYLSAWLSKGYRIVNTHYLGENPEGYSFMYILVREVEKPARGKKLDEE